MSKRLTKHSLAGVGFPDVACEQSSWKVDAVDDGTGSSSSSFECGRDREMKDDGAEWEESTEIHEIYVRNFAFEPKLTKIPVGATVRWWNQGKHQEQVQWTNPQAPSATFRSDIIFKGDHFSHCFDKSGTYHFHSTMFPWVKGTLQVMSNLAARIDLDKPLPVTERSMRAVSYTHLTLPTILRV